MSDHPVGHRGCEVFTFSLIARRWCIGLVHELMEADPSGATFHERADIRGLRGWVQVMGVDPVHAATVDLSEPLLVVPLRTELGEDAGPMVINGWHRVYRALKEGRMELPALMLTPEIEQAARIEIWR